MSESCAPPNSLTFGARVGLVIVVETAALSFLTVSALLLYILINSLRNTYRPSTRPGVQPWHFLRSPVDYYFSSLLFNDLIQATGSLLDAKWAHTGVVKAGTYCTMEGAVKQVGNVAVALATLMIACHTFAVLFFRWRAPDTKWLPLGFIALMWVFIICITAIPSSTHHDPPYYGPTTYWCWIDLKYRAEQIGLEYAIFWFTAFVNFTLYTPLYFCLRGNIVVRYEDLKGKQKMRIQWQKIHSDDAWIRSAEQRKEQMDAARRMIVYPVAYMFIITPISITRWIQFTPHHHIGSGPTFFADVVFASSGLVNALLYLATRPAILRSIFGSRNREQEPEQGDPRNAMTMQGVTVKSSGSFRRQGEDSDLEDTPARSRDHGDDEELQAPTSSGSESGKLSAVIHGEWVVDQTAVLENDGGENPVLRARSGGANRNPQASPGV